MVDGCLTVQTNCCTPRPMMLVSERCERVSIPHDEQMPCSRQAFELVLAMVHEMEI